MASKSKEEIVSTSNNLEVQKLRDTIQLLDNYSQHGFSQIAAIARIILLSLETKSAYSHFDDIAIALEAIIEKADDIKNCINSEAENTGCNFIDETKWIARRSRHTAREEVLETS
jgi:hypothetical protein